MNRKNSRVLVTGAGGAAAVSFMKAVENDGFVLFAGDIDVHAAGLYRVPYSRRLILPRGDDPRFAERVLELCREFEIGVVVPTVDCELTAIAGARDAFAAAGVALVMAPSETIAVCLDKHRLMEACRTVVSVPRSEVFGESFDPRGWNFPVILKPRTGSGSRGIMLVETPRELASIQRSDDLLVQEYLPGEEYSVDVYSNDRGFVVAAVPRVRLKVDSGIAVAARTVHDRVLENYARRVARAIGLRGVANVQFRRDASGEPALLEVNPRFPGTMPLTVAAGVNLPRLALREALGERIESRQLSFRETAVVRWLEETYVDTEAFDHLAREFEHAPDERLAS